VGCGPWKGDENAGSKDHCPIGGELSFWLKHLVKGDVLGAAFGKNGGNKGRQVGVRASLPRKQRPGDDTRKRETMQEK